MKDMDNIQYNYKDGQLCAEVPVEEQPAWWWKTREFIASIKSVPWFKPQGDPDPSWRVFNTRATAENAAWNAAWDAAGNAARNAAGDAAWDAVEDAARGTAWDAAEDAEGDAAWNATEDAALDAARNATRNVALDAVRNAAWDAAGDAALMAHAIITSGLNNVDEKHRAHARARWDVWKRGYGLWGDVGGVLYVYKRIA